MIGLSIWPQLHGRLSVAVLIFIFSITRDSAGTFNLFLEFCLSRYIL